MVKGVDLRSTAGHCAWVRTPQLTFLSIFQKWRIPLLFSGASAGKQKVEPSGFEPEAFRMQSERDTTTPRSQLYMNGKTFFVIFSLWSFAGFAVSELGGACLLEIIRLFGAVGSA